MPEQQPPQCAVEAAMRVIGGKWKPLILYYLLEEGVLRFGELKRRIPGITQQMLTLQLRELEADGIVHREVYRQVPPKVEYTLTPLGERLKPVLDLMLAWGADYMAERYPDVELLAAPPAGVGAEAAGDRAERPAL
jgi:DNA-binding HxlR family transcriptional regulator